MLVPSVIPPDIILATEKKEGTQILGQAHQKILNIQ